MEHLHGLQPTEGAPFTPVFSQHLSVSDREPWWAEEGGASSEPCRERCSRAGGLVQGGSEQRLMQGGRSRREVLTTGLMILTGRGS